MNSPVAPRVIAVVGATAAGKSDLGVALARELGGEVVNTDSMQLYKGMDIGTAKLTVEERCGIPHHLLDVWDVTVAASVAEYQRMAREVIDALLAQGRTPVLVGGSGLYVRAAIDELEFPGTDPEVRARLEQELDEHGSGELHRRLAGVDPLAAQAILPSNGRRIVRALEVVEITGKPYTANLPGHDSVYDAVQIGVRTPRPELDRRIALRVDRMWEAGLLQEVERLTAAGLREGRTASRALGYQQALAQLAGECGEQEAREETVRATKRFARRQESWFHRDPRVHWLTHESPADADGMLRSSLELVAAGRGASQGA